MIEKVELVFISGLMEEPITEIGKEESKMGLDSTLYQISKIQMILRLKKVLGKTVNVRNGVKTLLIKKQNFKNKNTMKFRKEKNQ
jgi:hypothetical protein